MGNTVPTTRRPTPEEEEERRFREKIGYISIIKDNAGTPNDLVSSIRGHTHSWATSVTSITDSLNSFSQDNNNNSSSNNKKDVINLVEPPRKVARATGPVNLKMIDMNKHQLMKQTLTAPTQSGSTGKGTNTTSKSAKQVSVQNNSRRPILNKQSSSGGITAIHSNNPSGEGGSGNGNAGCSAPNNNISISISNAQQMMQAQQEALLLEMQRKMAKVDQEQDSCLNQIKTMNQEMESFRRDALQKMQEKDVTISMHETEIDYLKQQILKLNLEHEEDKAAKATENRCLMRKCTSLKNQLTVAELEKEAAVAAAAAAHNNFQNNNHNFAESATGSNASYSSTEVVELRETIQELLQQLEDAEDEHQREQEMLQEEVLLLRKKLERLESEFIVVERERDDAQHKVEECEQQLEVEKALNASDVKKYQAELNQWKERCMQQMQFTPQSNKNGSMPSTDQRNKTAAKVGSRLGAGILEGIQEEETQRQQQNPATGRSFVDDESESFSRLVGKVKTISATPSQIEVTATSSPMAAALSVSESQAAQPSPSVWTVSSNASQGFDETISIPNFLSKVW